MSEPGRRRWWQVALRALAAVVLGAWMAGLVMAAVQLDAWSSELTHTLLRLRADAVFRMRMAEGREPIPREWYRSKALALLAASEKLRDDTTWTLLVPGSWQPFDDLRQRVAARIERAFSDIAVETVRRELYFRASELTGVPQDPQTAELLDSADCRPPPVAAGVNGSDAPQQLPEFIAVQNQLAALEQLDQAVQAMLALRRGGSGDADNLRLLVRFTLGVELPGHLSRSAAFFRTGLKPEDLTLAATGVPRMQQAARCSLLKGMNALDARLFDRNDLLAAEAVLAQHAPRLFSAGARDGAFAETVEGLREVVAALDQQEALLAQADPVWLRQADSSLGAEHESLLARAARIGLLGPEAVDQVRRQSGAALQQFRRKFNAVFGSGKEPALVWRQDRGRLMLSPQRLALRDGLVALLQEPYMAPPAYRAFPEAAPAPLSWNLHRLDEALAVADARQRVASDILPQFPPAVRRGIAQFVNGHLAQRVQDATLEAMAPAPGGPFDAAAYGAQREQLARVQALLVNLGARSRADKLRALLSRDLVDRLALIEQAMWGLALYSDRTQYFGWWQGEGSPILQAFGVPDGQALRYALSQQFGRFDEFGREAGALLAYVDPSIASSPAVQRWQGMVGELRRYRAGAADSSLLALERYLLALGADMSRSNCLEKLMAAPGAGAQSDEFAQRHRQIHQALMSRCVELRSPPGTSEPAQAAPPFG